jgi:hypothetical protein
MKKFLGTTVSALLFLCCLAQPNKKTSVEGIISDKSTHLPLSGAIIRIGERQAITDEKGYFIFTSLELNKEWLEVSSLGYESFKQALGSGQPKLTLAVELNPTPLFL